MKAPKLQTRCCVEAHLTLKYLVCTLEPRFGGLQVLTEMQFYKKENVS